MQDIRFALRQLRRDPVFAATAILTMAIGLSASVAIFAFVHAALIKPLPYVDAGRLVTAFATHPDSARNQGRGYVSYMNFRDWRSHARAFGAIAAYDVRAGFTLTTPEGPQRVPGLRVTSGFFRTLGVTPILGREFNGGEEGAAAPATVMLSYRAWQSRFASARDVVGQVLVLSGEPHVVIGVLPRGFHFPMAEHADFWTTIRGPQPCWEVRTCASLETIARLADGVTPAAATANLDAVVQDLHRQYPAPNPVTATLVPLRDVVLGDVRPIVLMFGGGAALLLSIACINVVNLLLARSDSRMRELAIRNALGASPSRLIAQFAAEALVLVVAGSSAGVAMAAWGIRVLRSLLSAGAISRMPYFEEIGLTFSAIVFACSVSAIAAGLFTITPVLRASVSERFAGLREGSKGSSGAAWRRVGRVLVAAELAIAIVLLASAGVLSKSLFRLLHVDAGFNTEQLAALSVSPVSGETALLEPRGVLAWQVAERAAVLPGVQAVGYADLLPLGPGLAPTSGFRIVGRPADGPIEAHPVRRVSAGYFNALQATLLRGRHFTEEEVTAIRPVMIINESARRRYFPGRDPLGESIVFGVPSNSSPARTIVGVIDDIKEGPPETPPYPAAYVPFDQVSFGLVVRTSQAERSILPSISATIRTLRSDLVVRDETTMTERMNRLPSTELHRSSAWLAGGFASVALWLAVVGLYGVVAYSVGQRTREIGVRIALGAERRSVYRLVLGQAASLVGVGTALGILCAVVAATLMRSWFFDVQTWDAPTLAATAIVLATCALAASYVPARRAASVNPIEALRVD